MLCKQVSLSIADLAWELGESSTAGTFEKKEKVYMASFLEPRGLFFKILSLGAI
jgi:hypothetical protein